DPIFAYGIFFAVQEGEFAAETIASFLSEDTRTNGNPFAEYEALCDQGNDITQDFIDLPLGISFGFPKDGRLQTPRSDHRHLCGPNIRRNRRQQSRWYCHA